MQSSRIGVFTAHKTLILCYLQTGVFWVLFLPAKVDVLFNYSKLHPSTLQICVITRIKGNSIISYRGILLLLFFLKKKKKKKKKNPNRERVCHETPKYHSQGRSATFAPVICRIVYQLLLFLPTNSPTPPHLEQNSCNIQICRIFSPNNKKKKKKLQKLS